MLQLDPSDEAEFDPEAPDDPGRQQKTSANAFKEYMAQRVDRVDPNTGIQVFTRPHDVAPGGQEGAGGPPHNTILPGTSGGDLQHHPGGAFARHLGHAHHHHHGEQRPTTPSGSMTSRSSTPAKGHHHHHHGSAAKRKRPPQSTPVKKKKKKKRRKVTSDSEEEESSDDDDEDPSWE